MTSDSNTKKTNDTQEPKSQPSPFMKYSGVGVQMAIFIGLGAWGGQYLDGYYDNKTPGWTIALCLTGVFASLYLLIKQVIKDSK